MGCQCVTTISNVWSHECVLRLNTNAAWAKFPTCVKFLLIPLKRSSNLTPLLSPAVSGGRWRIWYSSEPSTGERGGDSSAGTCLVRILPPSETVPVVADVNYYICSFHLLQQAIFDLKLWPLLWSGLIINVLIHAWWKPATPGLKHSALKHAAKL